MHPVLEQTYVVLSEQLQGVDLATTRRHPGEDATVWNMQQVIEHLLATYTTCTTSLEARLAKGRPLESKRSPWTRFRQWAVVDLGYFPSGRQAPEPVRPGIIPMTTQDGQGMCESVRAALTKMDDTLNRVAAVYPSRPVVTHMVLGPFSVRQWRKFHRVHARHHARQLARVKASTTISFPD